VTDDPAPKRNGKLKIELPFEDAIAAALETPPEPDEVKPFGKKASTHPDRPLRSKQK
jgi:hypothetical protein